jgi:periplasmic protein TonB
MYDNLRHRLEFDDLLFKIRNKDYGAYQLRKKYNSVVIFGIILASLIMSSAVIIPFIFTSNDVKTLRGGNNYVQVQMQNFEIPSDELIVPPAPLPPELASVQKVAEYIPPVIVDSLLPSEPTLATNDQLMEQTSIEKTDIEGTGIGEDMLEGEGGGMSDEAFIRVEVMPSFRGGDIGKFREWVGMRTNYPQAAINKNIQGTVFLTFIVEKDGSVSSVTVVKGVDPLLDDEAIRAISASPRWTPGLQRGQPVRVRFSIPLKFKP